MTFFASDARNTRASTTIYEPVNIVDLLSTKLPAGRGRQRRKSNRRASENRYLLRFIRYRRFQTPARSVINTGLARCVIILAADRGNVPATRMSRLNGHFACLRTRVPRFRGLTWHCRIIAISANFLLLAYLDGQRERARLSTAGVKEQSPEIGNMFHLARKFQASRIRPACVTRNSFISGKTRERKKEL